MFASAATMGRQARRGAGVAGMGGLASGSAGMSVVNAAVAGPEWVSGVGGCFAYSADEVSGV